MKKFFLLALALAASGIVFAQEDSKFSYGIRAGINAGAIPESDGRFNGALFGWHAGVQSRADFSIFFIRPELVYTSLRANNKTGPKDVIVSIDRLDLPVSFGIRFLKIISIFAGPQAQYIINVKSREAGYRLGGVDSRFSLLYNVGVGLELGKFGINLRYEAPFSQKNIALAQETLQGDSSTWTNLAKNAAISPSQFILALNFSF